MWSNPEQLLIKLFRINKKKYFNIWVEYSKKRYMNYKYRIFESNCYNCKFFSINSIYLTFKLKINVSIIKIKKVNLKTIIKLIIAIKKDITAIL